MTAILSFLHLRTAEGISQGRLEGFEEKWLRCRLDGDSVAADQRPMEKCLADVGKADIYVGIFAFRYGYVPPESHGNPDKLLWRVGFELKDGATRQYEHGANASYP